MPRMDQLHKLLEMTPNDPFLAYGIALEHKKAAEFPQAAEWLDKTIEMDAGYCYAYYQKGQVLEQLGKIELAKAAYELGIKAARQAGDGHAEGELQGALDMIA